MEETFQNSTINPQQISGLEVLNIPKANSVEHIMAESFSDPALWQEPFRGSPNIFGLVHPAGPYGPITDEEIPGPVNKSWLANIYARRVVADEAASTDGAVKIETGSLEMISEIHSKLNETILAEEHMRIATLWTPPNAKPGKDSKEEKENNDQWLEMIKNGQWPIMKYSDGTYFSHDYGDFHLGNFALFPREVQDVITEAAGHELQWRKRFANGEASDNVLLLGSEEMYDKNPFASGARGTVNNSEDGIMKIDNISDVENYMDLLAFVVDGSSESCEERLKSVFEYIDTEQTTFDNDPRSGAASGVNSMKNLIGDIVNFNTRHREGRNTTPEEVDEAFKGYLEGLLRVAGKIRGTV